MTKFIIATNNQKKLIELDRILNPLGICAVTARSAGINLLDVEENGSTFAQNAYIKAKAAFDLCKCAVVADDSGLCIDALDGRPGIFSARYAGENATDKEKIEKILSQLKDVPDDKRGAHFTCSICCILSNGRVITAQGDCYGSISHSPIGDGGFGYDPIFVVNGKSFAQLSNEEKDSLSHRGNALRKLREELIRYKEEL